MAQQHAQGGLTPLPRQTRDTTRWSMSPGKIVLAVLAGLFGMIAIGLMVGGLALVVIHTTQRDDDGFLTSPVYDIHTTQYAVVSESVDLASRPGDWWPADPATVKFTVDPVGNQAVFVGIGRASEIDAYVANIAHDEVTRLGPSRDDVTFRTRQGFAPTSLPGAQNFWTAATQGQGKQELQWDLEKGEWKVLIMNANGAADLRADVEAGVKIGILLPIGIGLIVAAVVLGAVATVMLVIALTGNRKPVERAV